jgi:dTDP-glucose 4,6-dehydratase
MGQALANEPLTVFGDGSQTRSFCYVDDLVEGLWRLLNSHENLPVNIGNPNEMTILEFARAVLSISGSKSTIVFKELPVDDPKVRQPDITKARALLGWEPKVELRDGLERTLAYFRARLGAQAGAQTGAQPGAQPGTSAVGASTRGGA